MDLYLIDCLLKYEGHVSGFKAIVKAKNAVGAWDKFVEKWRLEIKAGIADIPPETVIKHSVERVCSVEEAVL